MRRSKTTPLILFEPTQKGFHFNLRSWQPDVLRLVLEAYPSAAAEKDSTGNLPLHTAVEHGACVKVVDMLLKAYPDAARERGKCHQFPVPMFSDAAPKQNEHSTGDLPLHTICRGPTQTGFDFNLRSWQPDFLRLVLEAFPAAAAEKDSTGNLPLHTAVEHDACVKVVDMLLKAYPDAARERNTDHEFPLFLTDYCRAGCKGAPSEVAQTLINAYPAAVDW